MNISLVVPCYSEEANLQKGVLDKIGNFTRDDSRFAEVIFVDDGSIDSSRHIIKEKYLGKFPKLRLIENEHQGKAYAIITGICKAKGDFVLFSDVDLATPIEEAEKLIKEAQNGYPIVIGSRNTHRKGAPFLRKLMAVGFIIVRDILIGLSGIRDTQCGFKLFQKKAALSIIKRLKVFAHKKKAIKSPSVSAGFDLEFLFLAAKQGYRIKEVPIIWRYAETKRVNFLKDSLETMQDILKIKYFDITGKYST
ncbi:MAG TPA: glycosyltransferase [Patescibacteria group bacterium]|nr:glycosyltransferase [Patescibacteria group bacterium]